MIIKILERKNSPLFLNLIVNGITDYFTEKVLGYKLGYDFYLYLDGEIFVMEDTIPKVREKLDFILENEGTRVLMKFALLWEKLSKKIVADAVKTSKKKYIGKKELKLEFEKVVTNYYSLSTGLMVLLVIEGFLEGKIKQALVKRGRKDIGAELRILTLPKLKNENEKEAEALESISALVRDNSLSLDSKKIEHLILRHIKEFGWLNGTRFFEDAWTKQDVISRIKNSLEKEAKNGAYLDEEKLLLKQLELDREELQLVEIAKHYVFLRTHRMNCFVKAGYLLRPFLFRIAKELGLKFEDLIYLTPEEILDCLSGHSKPKINLIKERQKTYGYFINKEKIFNFSGNEYEKYKSKYLSAGNFQEITEIKGTSAFSGKIRGIVKIVRVTQDMIKVKRGDIMVSPMTIPAFVPAMERAAAFITDEGGILCHAAIVAREMRKPAIIGTRNATKILHDGDLVEVDADSGIIRIIKKI